MFPLPTVVVEPQADLSRIDHPRDEPLPSREVLTVLAIVAALFLLPAPWNWVTVLVAGVIDVLETAGFVWWSGRRRPSVGVEALVGRRVVVVRAVAPRGQVKVDGELWEARSTHTLLLEDEAIVTAVDGLVLEVERVDVG